MAHRFSPPQLIIGGIAVLLVLTACGADSSEDVAEFVPIQLVANQATVSLDGAEVPIDEPTPVVTGQPIVLDQEGLGLLSAGVIRLELFKETDLQFLQSDRLGLDTFLKSGHLDVESAQETDTRLRLDSANATITNLTPDFAATFWQGGDGASCLLVHRGRFEWSSGGGIDTLDAGESAFAPLGKPSGVKRCVSKDAWDDWFEAARRNEPVGTLADLVAQAPECADEVERELGEVAEGEEDGETQNDGTVVESEAETGRDGGNDDAAAAGDDGSEGAGEAEVGAESDADDGAGTDTGDNGAEADPPDANDASDDAGEFADETGETPMTDATESDPDFTG